MIFNFHTLYNIPTYYLYIILLHNTYIIYSDKQLFKLTKFEFSTKVVIIKIT